MRHTESVEAKREILQTVLGYIANEDFDFISLVDLSTGAMEILHRKSAEAVPYLLKDGATYLDNLSLFLARSVAKEVKAEALEKMA